MPVFTPSPAPSAGPRAKPVTRTTLRGSPCGTWPLWPPRPGAARFTHTGHARWHRRGTPSSGTQEVGNQARLLGLSLGPPFHHHPCPPTKGTSSCSLGDTSLGGEPGAPGPHPGTAPYCRAREQTPSPRWASVSSSTRIWEGCGAGSRGPVRTFAFRAVTQLGDPPASRTRSPPQALKLRSRLRQSHAGSRPQVHLSPPGGPSLPSAWAGCPGPTWKKGLKPQPVPAPGMSLGCQTTGHCPDPTFSHDSDSC